MAEIPLKKIVEGIAKRSGQIGWSTVERKHKVEEALSKTSGIEQARAKKIAEGLRSGTAKLSKEQAIKVLRGLKAGKLLKNVTDVTGEVNRFIEKQARAQESKQVEAKAKNLRRNLILQRRQESLAREAENAKTPELAASPRIVEFTPSPLTAQPMPTTPPTPANAALLASSGNDQNLNEPATAPANQDEPEDLPLAA